MLRPGVMPALQGYDWQGAMGGLNIPSAASTPLTFMENAGFEGSLTPGAGITTLMPEGGFNLARPAGGGFLGGLNGLDKGRLALGGLQTIGQLWSAWQQNKLAKDSLRFSKASFNRNLENQTKTYNTAMDDRVANRQAVYAGSPNQMSPEMAQAYLDKNRLSTRRVG